MLPVVNCHGGRRAANKALEEEVAKEQEELVKLSQTNEENRACQHACAAPARAVVRLHSPTDLPTVAPCVCCCAAFEMLVMVVRANISGGLVEMAASLVSAESLAAAAREAQLRPLGSVDSDQTKSTGAVAPAPAPAPTPTVHVRQTGARVAHTLVGLTSPSKRGNIGLDAAANPSKFPAPGSTDAHPWRQGAADEIASPTPMEISVSTSTETNAYE